MASPLSKGLIAGAIGESGALDSATLTPVPLAEAEQAGVAVRDRAGGDVAGGAARDVPAEQLLEAAADAGVGGSRPTVDGYFLPKDPVEIFAAGEQARVPLLVGWNSEEIERSGRPGAGRADAGELRQGRARSCTATAPRRSLKVYPAATDEEVEQAATDLAGDRFIGYSTWKWADLHGKTGGKPVYRYLYARPRPAMRPRWAMRSPASPAACRRGRGDGRPAAARRGAVHSAEIEYALGNLATNKVYAWTPDDDKVSEVMQGYFANFVKTGNPNGPGLPPGRRPTAAMPSRSCASTSRPAPSPRRTASDTCSSTTCTSSRRRKGRASMLVALLVLVVSMAERSVAGAPATAQPPRDFGCTEWHQCRELALAAADRGEYETFHDLAWRTVQTGPRNDPALMYLLARAQALSGRPHDALIMLQRLAGMGVASDAATNDDFVRTRQLPEWPDLLARIEA